MAHRVFTAETEIDATPEQVWAVLVDLPRYPEWNPFTLEVRSTLAVGSPIDMRVRMQNLGITVQQRETVREVSAPARLVWGMEMIGIRAERVQTLEALPDGRTRYRTDDTIEGPLAPLVFAIFGGSLEAGFRGVADGLREQIAQKGRKPARPQ